MATPHHLPKNRGALKSTQISFLRAPRFCDLSRWWLHWGCRGLNFVLNLSDQKTFPYFCMVLHDIVVYLFIYVCWRCCMILCCMIFCCVYCLLKAFPNCHSVCRPNNMYAPLSTKLRWLQKIWRKPPLLHHEGHIATRSCHLALKMLVLLTNL